MVQYTLLHPFSRSPSRISSTWSRHVRLRRAGGKITRSKRCLKLWPKDKLLRMEKRCGPKGKQLNTQATNGARASRLELSDRTLPGIEKRCKLYGSLSLWRLILRRSLEWCYLKRPKDTPKNHRTAMDTATGWARPWLKYSSCESCAVRLV